MFPFLTLVINDECVYANYNLRIGKIVDKNFHPSTLLKAQFNETTL